MGVVWLHRSSSGVHGHEFKDHLLDAPLCMVRNKKEGLKIKKEDTKLSLLADDMLIPKKTRKRL